ncbi:MAG: MBL fold metallo-hydrolase [Candidatus Aenigmarchaeota archaeon]|nr:MBL fold metallo-hydrolase [Candidatus Aenigmarchaeota archaeon]
MKWIVISILAAVLTAGCVQDAGGDNVDEISFNGTTVIWLGHATFEIFDRNTVIYTDPYVLPQQPDRADFILVSHDHYDHCDPSKIASLQTDETRIITTHACIQKGLTGRTNTLAPGEFFEYMDDGLTVEAIQAYNLEKDYHPNGSGIGFVFTFNGRKFYFAGDTDNIPEMAELKDIYMAFLPIGGTYTMNVEEAAEAAKAIKPKIVVPMHYNSDKYGIDGINAEPSKLKKLLEDTGIQVAVLNPVV